MTRAPRAVLLGTMCSLAPAMLAESAEGCLGECVTAQISTFLGSADNGVDKIYLYVDAEIDQTPHMTRETIRNGLKRWNCGGTESIPGIELIFGATLEDLEALDFSADPNRTSWRDFPRQYMFLDFRVGEEAELAAGGDTHPAKNSPEGRLGEIWFYELCPADPNARGGLSCFGDRYIRWNEPWGAQAVAHEIGHLFGLHHDADTCAKSVMSAITSWNDNSLGFTPDHCELANRLNDADNLCNSVSTSGACAGCLYEVSGKLTGISDYQSITVTAQFRAGGVTRTETANTTGGRFRFLQKQPSGVEFTLTPETPSHIGCATVEGTVEDGDTEVSMPCECDPNASAPVRASGFRRAVEVTTVGDVCNPLPDHGIWIELFPWNMPVEDFCQSVLGLCDAFTPWDFWWWRAPRLPGDCLEDRVCYYFRPCPSAGEYPVDEDGGCQLCYDTCTVSGAAFFGPPVVVDPLPDAAAGTIEISGWAGGPRRLDGMVVLLDKEPITLDGWTLGLLRFDACAWAKPGEDCNVFSGFKGQLDTRNLSNGTHELMIFAGGGDTDQPVPSVFTYDLVVQNDCTSTTPPTIQLSGLVAGGIVAGTVPLQAQATSAEGVEQVRFFVDGVRRSTDWSAPYEFAWNTLADADGPHEVRAVAVDRCGLSAGTEAITVTVANANDPPELALETPTPLLRLSGVAPVSGWAVDTDGIESVSLRLGTQILPLASAVTWVDRSDVCSGSGVADPRCPRVGWQTSFDTTLWPDGDYTFQVVVLDGRGASAERSISLSIRNAPIAPPTVSTPASKTVVEGEDVSFTVSVSGEGPFAYRWQYRSGTSWLSLADGERSGRISGTATPKLSIADVVTADQSSYRCVVENEGGATASSAASLTVHEQVAPPTVSTGLDQRVTEGDNAYLQVSAQGVEPLTYQWQRWNGSWVDLVDDGRIGGTTTDMLAILGATSADAGQYRARVSNDGGTTDSSSIALSVDPVPVGTCQETSTTLCFQSNRFAVSATVNGGAAWALPFSQEGGFFWMFEPNTVEVAIKILDGTAANGYFWVFHGSLTDLAYTVTVTDTITGASKTYLKDDGHFCGEGDTTAFHGSTTAPSSWAGYLVPLAPSRVAAESGTPCASSGTLACLLNGKFGVEVLQSGSPQPGLAVTDLSASFGFVTATAPEVVVKVIDGTSVNEYYWLFFGSLTHQDFTVRVTDSATGEYRTYVSPGQFCGGADTTAF